MGIIKFTTVQINNNLREAEVLQPKGLNIGMICKQLEIQEQILPLRKEMHRSSQTVEITGTR